MRQIYLDHNATTWMEQSAQRALLLYSSTISSENFEYLGNPSSIHWAGRKAKALVDNARDTIAEALGLEDPDSLFFTSSATEATNTALKGFFFSHQNSARRVCFLSTQVEHEATLETLRFLEREGAVVTLLPVNSEGELSIADFERALSSYEKSDAVLVSMLAANNETGVLFPWEKAADLTAKKDLTFHLDAVQSFGKDPDFTLRGRKILASLSAHKIGGPKGVGALVVPRGSMLVSLLHGGAQERKRRAGTLNVPGIVSFAAAASAVKKRNFSSILKLRNILEAGVLARIPGSQVLGFHAARLGNTSNFLFDGVRGEGLVMGLDLEGFAVSSGSACNSGSILPSHVLMAMGYDKLAASSAVRVSISSETSEEEIALFMEALEKVVSRIRSLNHN